MHLELIFFFFFTASSFSSSSFAMWIISGPSTIYWGKKNHAFSALPQRQSLSSQNCKSIWKRKVRICIYVWHLGYDLGIGNLPFLHPILPFLPIRDLDDSKVCFSFCEDLFISFSLFLMGYIYLGSKPKACGASWNLLPFVGPKFYICTLCCVGDLKPLISF